MKRITSFFVIICLLLNTAQVFAECKWKDISYEVVESESRLKTVMDASLIIMPDVSFAFIEGKRVPIDANDSTVTIVKQNDNVYIPVRFVTNAFNGECEYYEQGNRVYLHFTNYTIHFALDSDEYCINDKVFKDESATTVINDRAYISDKVLRKSLSDYFYYCDNGMVIIAPYKFKLDDSSYNAKAKLEAMAAGDFCYERPSAQTISQAIQQNCPNKQHPRLLINAEKKQFLLDKAQTDEIFRRISDNAIKAADRVVANDKIVEYIKDERSTILEKSREAKSKWIDLCAGYLFTGDQKYVDRAWKEFEAVAAFPDWNPHHFLDVGEMSFGAALVYDWMYDGLTQEQKAIMREQFVQKTFLPSLEMLSTKNSYFYSSSNWNAVCNGGASTAALAIADEEGYSEMACDLISKSLIGLESMMKTFAPQGAWNEGLGYWGYTTEFFAYLMSSVINACGTHYGIMYAPGVRQTAYYPMNLERPNKSFYSFGDSGGAGGARTSEWAFFASVFKDTALQKKINNQLKNGSGGFYEMCYYDPTLGESDKYQTVDMRYLGSAEVLTMRGSRDDPNALFVGARAGYMLVNHGHADIGSFVFDADGIEWFSDNGSGNYAWSSYFGRPKRYLYYRTRAESHNMVVVNPDAGEELYWDSTTNIDFISKERGAIAVMDMTNTYNTDKDVMSAKRGLALINDRTGFLVQDEIKTNKNGEFYWFGHTKAETITLSDDGKTALLEKNGKKLHVQILSPANGKFTIGEDRPLSTTPQFDCQESNFKADVKKLSIHVQDTNDVTFSVFMTPVKGDLDINNLAPKVTPINEWTVDDGEIPHIDTLSVDGEEVIGYDKFASNCTLYYEEPSEKAPIIQATSDKYNIIVEQAQNVPGTAVVSMYNNDEIARKYFVNFELENQFGVVDNKKKYKVKAAEASAVPESQNSPANLIDNNPETKWAAQNDQNATFDLGEEKKIDAIGVTWYSPATRISPIEIEVSNDGINWTTTYKGKSRGVETSLELYEFTPVHGRFVRLNVHGNGTPPTGWNSIMEVCIYGPKEQ